MLDRARNQTFEPCLSWLRATLGDGLIEKEKASMDTSFFNDKNIEHFDVQGQLTLWSVVGRNLNFHVGPIPGGEGLRALAGGQLCTDA